jgi:hypothetical protein
LVFGFLEKRSVERKREVRRVLRSTSKRIVNPRSHNRCGRKSGNRVEVFLDVQVAGGVIFRKRGCGFEGKWRSGFWGVDWVPGDARFPQLSLIWVWICGVLGGEVGLGLCWCGCGLRGFSERLGVRDSGLGTRDWGAAGFLWNERRRARAAAKSRTCMNLFVPPWRQKRSCGEGGAPHFAREFEDVLNFVKFFTFRKWG